ncbi:hypothetical protein [Chitinophaga ginsengisoli]|uniref:MHYT domain-containing protein n=1 Tax=Chitinophaga ginsengisoli TaxID=363837 RepID=A0A2P8FZC7_9BACT|nr:hypothetical protein [Chitinophaga ginsengisoli]PSL27080.1 hypothetical protein CLV42_110234 [Chitinophaga ginsengisoli]
MNQPITDNNILKKFTQRQVIFYFTTNVIINALVPYFGFDDLNTVYLFRGEHPVARFFLPMALLLPLCITIDILNKTTTLLEKEQLVTSLPPKKVKIRFMLKTASLNAIITLFLTLAAMLGIHACLPENYSFNGTLLSILSGILAGGMAIFFTLQPIHKVKKLYPR